jgi:hypothetical protein
MNNTAAHVTQAFANAIGKKYCSHHQGEAAIDAGSMVTRNKTRRWICFRCQEKSKKAGVEPNKQ